MSLFEQFILQEAVPKKAKDLGITPEAPPDLTRPDNGQQQQQPMQQPDQSMQGPADVDPNAGLPPDQGEVPQEQPAADPNAAADPGMGQGAEGDPNATGEADPNAAEGEDPNAQADALQGPDGVGQEDELQAADQQIYAELKPEQRKIQTRELKERFQDLYTIITDSLDKLNKVTKTSYDANMIDLATKQLLELKDLVFESITGSFSTRTYVQNKVELQKLATMYNAITNMITLIYDARVRRATKYAKNDSTEALDKIDFTQDLGF